MDRGKNRLPNKLEQCYIFHIFPRDLLDPMEEERPRSLRSVASNSTIASGTSLSRRPRIRRRSRTVTGVPNSLSEPPLASLPVQSDLPYLSDATAQEPTAKLSPAWTGSFELPPRPPKSPHRQLSAELPTRSGDSASSQGITAVDATVVSDPLPLPAITSAKPVRLLNFFARV